MCVCVLVRRNENGGHTYALSRQRVKDILLPFVCYWRIPLDQKETETENDAIDLISQKTLVSLLA